MHIAMLGIGQLYKEQCEKMNDEVKNCSAWDLNPGCQVVNRGSYQLG